MQKLFTFLYIFSILCGTGTIKFSDIEELIVGGQSVQIDEIPYQAALYYYGFYFCAGSIITPTQIITAAHCVMYMPTRPVGLFVRVGSSRMHSGGQIAQVEKITLHPKFSLKEIDYDVAVIRLKKPLKFTKVVQPLEVGEKEPLEGEEVRVSGWGYTKEIGYPSRKLQSVTVNTISRKSCAQKYKNFLVITNRMICAFGENKDACYGDSGGPLVHKNKLIGIVSTGEGCGRKDFPGVYTNVANSEIQKFLKTEINYRAK